jgi:hypothetical protein
MASVVGSSYVSQELRAILVFLKRYTGLLLQERVFLCLGNE